MKNIRIVYLLLAAALLPEILLAQVEKRVEVSKTYIPNVEHATKLTLHPDMTDTVKIHPDIDYTVTPLAFSTSLSVRPMRPATVTYWEFNRPKPLYLKVGAGYPLNSVLDFYASTQNAGTGYVVGSINHEGSYANIRNEADEKHNSTQMYNRIGVAAGYYLGRRTIEMDMSYDNRLLHRYGAFAAEDQLMVGDRIDYGQANVRVRFGDDFTDMKRFNFNIEANGSYFYDNSQALLPIDDRQINGGVHAKLGRHIGRHTLLLQGGFDGIWGKGDLSSYRNQRYDIGLRYAFTTRTAALEFGLDYHHSRIIELNENKHNYNYILPYAKIHFDLGKGILMPYIEFDGNVRDNSFCTLTHTNPYIVGGLTLPKNTVAYNLTFGADGKLFDSRLVYRLFLRMTWMENAPYWFGTNAIDPETEFPTVNFLQFSAIQARRNQVSFNGEIEWKPAGNFSMMIGVYGSIYDNTASMNGILLGGGLPVFRGILKADYTHRKFSIGLSAEMKSVRHWTNVLVNGTETTLLPYKTPITVDLRAHIDWHISHTVTVFTEGRNLVNQRLYTWANYPELGANFTAGVKLTF
ncbi:MAG: hypothetical protein RR330_01940 [Alistipes sp.]